MSTACVAAACNAQPQRRSVSPCPPSGGSCTSAAPDWRAWAAACAGLVAAGCGSSSGGGGGAGSATGATALRIPLLTTFNGLPFYTAMLCGAQDAAKKLGGDITISSERPT